MTLLVTDINYLRILVAAVASFIIGGLWYSPVLFGNYWLKQKKFSPQKMKNMKKGAALGYFWGFIMAIITALVLDQFIQAIGVTTISRGILVAFWAWVGFYLTTLVGSMIWEGNSKGLFFVNAGYWLVNLLVMGIVLSY
jgi:hypothetical protein